MSSLSAKVFVMQYMERAEGTETVDAITEPKLYPTYMEALMPVWEYVKGRIKDSCTDLFSEWAYSDLAGFSDNFADFDECDALSAEELFSNMEGRHIHDAVKWYFDFVNDEQCDAFFDISEVAIELPKVNFSLGVNGAEENIVGELIASPTGVSVSFDGYTTSYSNLSTSPVMNIGTFDKDPVILIHSDLVCINPTYAVSIKGARAENRDPNFKHYHDQEVQIVY